MNSIFPWLGIAVLILCGWAIVKKYQVNMVLLLGGLILNLLAFWGGAEIFPKKFSATGIVGFDLVELLRTISVSQVSGVGFLILISGGFAAYMQAIGASDRFVTVCAKPLSLIKNPYLILAAVFIVGHCLGLVITSAAGLAMLMVVTVYPLIIRVGCSPLAAAAVVASVLAIGYAPASGTANFASELVHLDPIEYLVRYQLPMAVPTILAMAAAHVVTQYWFDKREGRGVVADLSELEQKREKLEQTPAFYACLPLLPIALLLVFNKFVWGVSMNVATAMFIAWIASFFIDLITRVIRHVQGNGLHPHINRRLDLRCGFLCQRSAEHRHRCTSDARRRFNWSWLHRLQRGAFGYCRRRHGSHGLRRCRLHQFGTACSGCGTKFWRKRHLHDADDAYRFRNASRHESSRRRHHYRGRLCQS